jgi:hypothetical protein
MDDETLLRLLDDVRGGAVAPDAAASRLRRLPFADLGFARVDHHRSLRQGLPEAVYGPGKTPAQCAAIVTELLTGSEVPVVLTRASPEQLDATLGTNPGATVEGTTAVWRPAPTRPGRVTVVTAGTADLPVAAESATVLTAYGVASTLVADCGVAGLHRLLDAADALTTADVVIVVAGMEGALASVVGGLVACPVVAVPTSVGYGSAFEGITALLAMTASCAAGVTVVGIDNGYGAACAAARILGRRVERS